MMFRYIVSFLGCMAFAVVFMLRANMSVAIVSMTSKTAPPIVFNESQIETCQSQKSQTSHSESLFRVKEGEFDWDEYTQGVILGSFYYGYVVANLFGGRLAEIVGSKTTISVAVALTCILTFLTPAAARLSPKVLICVRVLEGVSEGLLFPGLSTLCSRWFAKSERSTQFSIISAGMSFGVTLGTLVTGVLCSSDIFGGWPSAFYIPGLVGFLWLVIWFIFVSEFPVNSRWISEKELMYIINGQGKEKPTANAKVPWCKIFKSGPYWAILISAFFNGFSTMLLLTDIPTFVGNILGFGIVVNGILSTVPFVLEGFATVIAGLISDVLVTKKILSTNKTRKLFYAIGSILPAICILCIIPSGCNLILTSTLLILSKGFDGLTIVGPGLALLDMAPNFSGTLTGIYNSVFCLQGIIAPLVVGLLTENNVRLCFTLASGLKRSSSKSELISSKEQEEPSTVRLPLYAS